MMKTLWLAALGLGLAAAPVGAHEFWIEPHASQVSPGEPLVADILVGDKLDGATYAYLPPNFRRFDILGPMGRQPVVGRPGDKPALNMAVGFEGLATVVHVTRDYNLTYTEWEKFVRFTEHKDFTWAVDRHLERGLGQERVRERYSRHGKALIAVGNGDGQDVEAGLLTEIVALANPYTDDLSDGFPVRVLFEGKPRAGVQVELFERNPAGALEIRLFRTDIGGRAVLDVKPGHFYLVDAVVMRELEVVEERDPAWESLWASLTFSVPG